MRGPIFKQLIADGKIELSSGESLLDLETIYSIIIAERIRFAAEGGRRRQETFLSDEDEQIVLIVWCKIHWPGKTRAFREQVENFRKKFARISVTPELRRNLRSRIRPALLEIQNPNELTFESLEQWFVVKDNPDRGRSGEGGGFTPAPDIPLFIPTQGGPLLAR